MANVYTGEEIEKNLYETLKNESFYIPEKEKIHSFFLYSEVQENVKCESSSLLEKVTTYLANYTFPTFSLAGHETADIVLVDLTETETDNPPVIKSWNYPDKDIQPLDNLSKIMTDKVFGFIDSGEGKMYYKFLLIDFRRKHIQRMKHDVN